MVLAIANRLKKQLEAVGAFVLMTRAGDTNLTLAGRAALANRNNADAFISIHANANYSASISGTSTYYYGGSGQPAVRKKLAGLVQTEMVKSLGRINRGVLTANFAVLRETTVPSILVETAFISNPTRGSTPDQRRFSGALSCRNHQWLDQIFSGIGGISRQTKKIKS